MNVALVAGLAAMWLLLAGAVAVIIGAAVRRAERHRHSVRAPAEQDSAHPKTEASSGAGSSV